MSARTFRVDGGVYPVLGVSGLVMNNPSGAMVYPPSWPDSQSPDCEPPRVRPRKRLQFTKPIEMIGPLLLRESAVRLTGSPDPVVSQWQRFMRLIGCVRKLRALWEVLDVGVTVELVRFMVARGREATSGQVRY